MHAHKPAPPPARIRFLAPAALVTLLASLTGIPAARAVATAPPAARAVPAVTAGGAVTGTSRDMAIVTAKILIALHAAQAARQEAPATVTVRAGDTLSGLAQAICAQPQDWTGLYAANRGTIGPSPNVIEPGQVLATACQYDPGLLGLASPAQASPSSGGAGNPPQPQPAATAPAQTAGTGKVWGVTYGYPYYCGDGDGDGYDEPCSEVFPQHPGDQAARPAATAPVQAAPAQAASTGGGYSAAPGSFQQCVIDRESGGDSQVMNSSGHYGLYQFSASSWAAYGGDPADFGHASVAEQNQVFQQAYAQAGAGPWAPYDGC
jgi:Transglycosylase-like domain/LysM domain